MHAHTQVALYEHSLAHGTPDACFPNNWFSTHPRGEASGGVGKSTLAGPCPHVDCPSHEYCVPDGADFDEEYRIAEVVGDPPHDYCMLDRDLTLVEFAAPEEE